MFCVNCGKEINNSAVVCPFCGARTGNAMPSQPAQPVQTTYYQQPPAPTYVTVQRKEPKSNTLGIAGFVLSLLSFVLGEFFLIAPFIGFILSCIAVAKRKNYDENNGLAIAGLVINIIQLVVWLIILIVCGSLIIGIIAGVSTM